MFAEEKKALRQRIKQQTKALSPDERLFLSRRLLKCVEANPRFLAATTVLLYHSLPDEVGTHAFVERWAAEKEVLLPVVCGGEMHVSRYIPAGGAALGAGAFSILEPIDATPYLDAARVGFALVPGVAFDRAGRRLGRGKGFYDRFFAQPAWQHVWKCGLCFPHQVCEAIPHEQHDILMDEIVLI